MTGLTIPVLYGSYRSDRMGIRAAHFAISRLSAMGHAPELVDAKALNLPVLDRMYKEYPKGEAPAHLESLAALYRRADAFVIVAGEYNQSLQPGLKNLLDHFLEEYFWRPSGIVCYSQGMYGGVRAMIAARPVLAELGMPSISSQFPVPRIRSALSEEGEPQGEAAPFLEKSFAKFAADLIWWAEAAKAKRTEGPAPY
jgi:NAD(P)H-dependent FMN reductase